jgi:hypothetical protein
MGEAFAFVTGALERWGESRYCAAETLRYRSHRPEGGTCTVRTLAPDASAGEYGVSLRESDK